MPARHPGSAGLALPHPGRFIDHARKIYLTHRSDEPFRGRLVRALRRIARARSPLLVAGG